MSIVLRPLTRLTANSVKVFLIVFAMSLAHSLRIGDRPSPSKSRIFLPVRFSPVGAVSFCLVWIVPVPSRGFGYFARFASRPNVWLASLLNNIEKGVILFLFALRTSPHHAHSVANPISCSLGNSFLSCRQISVRRIKLLGISKLFTALYASLRASLTVSPQPVATHR